LIKIGSVVTEILGVKIYHTGVIHKTCYGRVVTADSALAMLMWWLIAAMLMMLVNARPHQRSFTSVIPSSAGQPGHPSGRLSRPDIAQLSTVLRDSTAHHSVQVKSSSNASVIS